MQHYNDILSEVLIDEETLKARIRELGAEISADYPDGNLLLICILRGGVPFLVHLSRHIAPHMVDFMAASLPMERASVVERRRPCLLDLQTDIRDKDVLLVEDIIDSGHTIASVLEMLNLRQPRSLKVCALLDKAERREAVVPSITVASPFPTNSSLALGSISTSIIATCPLWVSWTWKNTNRLLDLRLNLFA